MLAKYYNEVGAGSAPTITKTLYDKNSPAGRDVSREGAFSIDSTVRFDVTVPRRLGAAGVVLRIARDGEEYGDIPLELGEGNVYSDNFSITLDLKNLCAGSESGLFYYEFLFLRGYETLFTDTYNNVDFELSQSSAGRFRLLIYSADYKVPSWFGNNIVYHIFVDRFCKTKKFPLRDGTVLDDDWDDGIPQYADVPGGDVENNVFFGGDLDGITQNLDYLEGFGVGTIYLSPIFDSPSNHKYDTADYTHIDDMFGGEDAFDRLVSETKKRGIKIILDGVFNHTGDDSKYFDRYGKYGTDGAYQTQASPYFKWYNFKNYPDEYECWWNIKIMPRLKQERRECRSYFTSRDGICAEYVKRGIAGWRLDVADELCDEFLDELRQSVKQYSDGEAVIIGEVWENAAEKQSYGKRRRYFQGKQLDSVMNYPLRNGIIDFVMRGDGNMLYDILTEIYSSYPRKVCDALMNLVGTHDTERILTVLGDAGTESMSNPELAVFKLSDSQRGMAKKRLMVASVLQYTVYGTPSLYYGDEAGVEGGRDPFCRLPYPWGRQDEQLMQHYKTLGKIRREQKVYRGGDFKILDHGNGYFAFERSLDGESVITVANSGNADHTFELQGIYKNLITGQSIVGNITLGECEAAILKRQGDKKDV